MEDDTDDFANIFCDSFFSGLVLDNDLSIGLRHVTYFLIAIQGSKIIGCSSSHL